MKKIVLLLIFCLFLQMPALAKHTYTCPVVKEIPHDPGTILAKITGMQYFAVQSVEAYLQHYIKKNYGCDIKIDIKAKSLKALKKGEFRQVSATSKKIKGDGFTISDFKAKTLCPYNRFIISNDYVFFPYNIPAEFSATVTNEDLQYMSSCQNSFFKVNSSFLGISKINWRIENSRLKITLEVATPFVKTRVTVSTGLAIKNGKVVLYSPSGTSTAIKFDVNKILPFLNYHNPFSYVVKLAENADSFIDLDELTIKDDKIYVKGIFLIPKNCDINK